MMAAHKEKYFRQVYETHKDKIYRLCLGFMGSNADADDLFQEILIIIWKNLGNFRNESKISTWIYRIATNTALLYVKRRKKSLQKITTALPEQLDETQENTAPSREYQITRLHRAISELKEIDRIITSLLLEDCSYQEIAEITGLKPGNVGVRITRIKKTLNKKLTNNE